MSTESQTRPDDKKHLAQASSLRTDPLRKQDACATTKSRSLWWFRIRFFGIFALASLLFAWTYQFFFNDLFFMAVESGDRAKVVSMLRLNPWLVYAGDRLNKRASPLCAAINNERWEISSLLLRKGASANGKDANGMSAFFLALRADRMDLVELMLARCANVNWDDRDENGQSVLFYAVGVPHVDWEVGIAEAKMQRVKYLLSHRVNVNAKAADGRAPLHHAAFCRNAPEIIELLLANKADPNLKDNKGEAPLFIAARNSLAAVKPLVLHGADIMARANDGSTPLHNATASGQKEIVEFLLARGADVNARKGDGEVPLHWAPLHDDADLIKLLVAHGADVNAKDTRGITPLGKSFTWFAGRLEAMKCLISLGADVRTTGIDGETALHTAASKGDLEFARLLIAKGADINAKGRSGDTPLHETVPWDRKSIVELLIASGADVNVQNSGGDTPLHDAVLWGRKSIVELLIASGADVNLQNRAGASSLALANKGRMGEIAELLRQAGAKE